jgi:hypothetical protein
MNEENSFKDIEDVEFESFSLWYVKECIFVTVMKRTEYFKKIGFYREWDCDIININLN